MQLAGPGRSTVGEATHEAAPGLGPRTPYERTATIHQVFSAQAARTPLAIAVVSDAGFLTYAELELRSNRLAGYLGALGVGPGAAVGVAFDRSLHLPVALLGILKAGAAYVQLDLGYPYERLAFMCADAAVSVVLTAGSPADCLRRGGLRTIDLLDDAAAIEAVGDAVAIKAVCDSAAIEMVGDAGDALASETAVDRAPVRDEGADSLAYITYTSGSTGRPKGVAIEHRGVVRLVRGADYFAVAPGDAFLQFAPLAFDASTFDIWAPLLNGARLAVPRPGLLSMDELAASIDRFGVTTLFLTTSIFERLVDTPSARPRSLRRLFTGGEVASVAHMRRFRAAFPDCSLVAVYGPTENTTFSTWCEIDALEPNESVPIGRPIANSSAYVLDESLRPVPVGTVGELCVGGDGVARGYLNASEASAERFVPDPFAGETGARLYRTGDRARYRADGLLEFLGRSDDQVKVRGFRIELGEVETALRTHPGVATAAVVLAQRDSGKTLVAYVVAAPGACLGQRALREHLAEKLPPYMLPARIELLETLPVQANGKVDRQALLRLAANAPKPARSVAPTLHPSFASTLPPSFSGARTSGTSQRRVAEIWRTVLGAGADPGLDENFFDVGGDSLSLLSLHRRLQIELGVSLSITDLFTHTTIRKQAAFVERPRDPVAQ